MASPAQIPHEQHQHANESTDYDEPRTSSYVSRREMVRRARQQGTTASELSRHALSTEQDRPNLAVVPDIDPSSPATLIEQGVLKRIGKWAGEHKAAAIGTTVGVAGSLVASAVLNMSHDSQPAKVTHFNEDGSVTTSHTAGELEIDPTTGYLDVSSLDKDGNGIMSEDELKALPDAKLASQIDPAQLVAAYGSTEFDKYRMDELNNLKAFMSSDQLAVLNENTLPSGPKENWTDQEILNAISVDVADATAQPTQKDGQQFLATVMSPKYPGYQEVFNSITGPPNAKTSLSVYNANGNPYPKLSNEFMGIGNLSTNARLIYGTYVHDGKGDDNMATPVIVMLVDLQKGSDGTSSEWRQLGFWNINDADFQVAAPKVS